ncbi:MAG: GTP cyclohydrolase II [Candidatus Thalassarchaeaceae archaeon]|jgi:GTP cyclohydrolase II|nr:GTP cyclohydrolase II [Euryarchaeota archaeon]MDP6871584.1 GTP cyclohydrolase II [Candidatus Thalassarchaeaceae archaeon]|tara:strand:+ start:3507 stop:4139 length:633 start_codon:yes stop_codon:yes gene_type:complete
MNRGKVRIQETGEIPADARLPTSKGDFRIRVFNDSETGMDHVALTLGEMQGPDPVLVRVHSECLTGDAFGSLRCDCGPQLDAAINMVQEVGWGCILYLRQEGRGIGLHAKIQAYNLQDKGADTVEANLLLGHPADARDYGVASDILSLIGIDSVCLLTNNPDKIGQLVSYGINVEERMPLVVGVGEENRDYLAIKVDKMGHDITSEDLER